MKLKYIIGVVLSALILTGCSEDQTLGSLGSISLDKTYVSIPEGGGDVTVKVTANQDWRLADVFVVSEKDADGNLSFVSQFYVVLQFWTAAVGRPFLHHV